MSRVSSEYFPEGDIVGGASVPQHPKVMEEVKVKRRKRREGRLSAWVDRGVMMLACEMIKIVSKGSRSVVSFYVDIDHIVYVLQNSSSSSNILHFITSILLVRILS